MKKYTSEDLNNIRVKRMEKMKWQSRLGIRLRIVKFTIEPRSSGFDYWTCYKLNLWNPLTWIYVVPITLVYVFFIAPVHAMIKEGINSVKDIISMAKGERYG